MKRFVLWVVLVGCLSESSLFGAVTDEERVILDETSVRNLGVTLEVVKRRDFETTLFALGRVEVMPSRRAVVSSRIAGRIVALEAFEGDWVEEGDVVAVLESRQTGNPPPKIELRAPLGGVVAKGHRYLGEPVEPDSVLLEILDLSEVYAVAQVPEDQVAQLEQGTHARLIVPALPGGTIEAELLRLGVAADPKSGTVPALFVVPNATGRIRPGMRVEFSIITETRSRVLSVPKEAVISEALGDSVFISDFGLPDSFIKSAIQIGATNDRYVEVLRGVFPGDEVVLRGAYPLAFAGGGTISLKEALDAAHGHEHNEDGSEMTAADRQKSRAQQGGVGSYGGSNPALMWFLAGLSSVLLGLLVLTQWQLSRFRNRGEARDA